MDGFIVAFYNQAEMFGVNPKFTSKAKQFVFHDSYIVYSNFLTVVIWFVVKSNAQLRFNRIGFTYCVQTNSVAVIVGNRNGLVLVLLVQLL